MLNWWARIPVKPTDWGLPLTLWVLPYYNTSQPGSQLHYWLIFRLIFWRFLFCFLVLLLLQVVLVACFFVCFFFLLPALEQLACSFPPSALSWRAFVVWVRLREVGWGRSLRVSGCVCVCVFDLDPFGRLWKYNLHVGCLKLQLGEKLLIPGRRDPRKRSWRRRRRRRWWWWRGRWWCCCCSLCLCLCCSHFWLGRCGSKRESFIFGVKRYRRWRPDEEKEEEKEEEEEEVEEKERRRRHRTRSSKFSVCDSKRGTIFELSVYHPCRHDSCCEQCRLFVNVLSFQKY